LCHPGHTDDPLPDHAEDVVSLICGDNLSALDDLVKKGGDMCTQIGLAFNLVGTILVAFSFRKGTVVAWQEKDKKPKMQSMVHYRALMFKTGISVLSIGFLFQFIATL